jgi:hypothetical protein
LQGREPYLQKLRIKLHGFTSQNTVIWILISHKNPLGWDSVVYIAPPYGLDGPGIESRWQRDFLHPSRPAWGPTSLLHNSYWVSFLRVKRPGRGVDHPRLSNAEVKEKSRAIPLLPLWDLMACSRVKVTFTLPNSLKSHTVSRLYFAQNNF